jgi:hypothetical protein
MTTTGSNRLAVLAAEIRDADGRFRRSAEEAAAAALEAGRLLVEAKALLKHGTWLPWLREHCAMSARSATRYMRIAKSGLEIGRVADLGIRAVDEALAKPMPETDEPDADAEPEPEPAYDFGIPINDVKFVRDYYPRSEFDLEYVRELSEILDVLPPIEINQHNELIDGRYRWEAHKARGMRRIRVVVTHTDDPLDCMCLAAQRNSSHGFRYTNNQLRAARQKLEMLRAKEAAAKAAA